MDTARVDALEQVQDEYDFITDVDSIWSVGGASAEWLARTFDTAHINQTQDTAFLSAQGHIQTILDTKLQYENRRNLPFKLLRFTPSTDINKLGKVEGQCSDKDEK